MKSSDLVDSIARFFNDIIGVLAPGLLLVLTIGYILGEYASMQPQSGFHWLLLLGSSYIVGHAITSVGETLLVKRVVDPLLTVSWLRWIPCLFTELKSEDAFWKGVAESVAFQRSAKLFHLNADFFRHETVGRARHLRNMAMSRIDSADNEKIYRFMFISLFCQGVATALLVCLAFAGVLGLLGLIPALSEASIPPMGLGWPAITVAAFVVFFLLERRYRFYSIAMRLPFVMVAAKPETSAVINQEVAGQKTDDGQEPSVRAIGARVFLSGGFRSGWQDGVVRAYPGVSYLDPRRHGLELPSQYTAKNLADIAEADIVFAHMDVDNPSGFGLALEVGFAKALGKPVILSDEKSAGDPEFERYFATIVETADASFRSLDAAISRLGSQIGASNSVNSS